VSIYLSFC